MNKLSKLGREEFLKVVRAAPLVSVDVVLQDDEGRVLMGLRSNEPAKGFWFVPGGRILKGERIAEAFERVVTEELGCTVRFAQARFLGVFQHFWDSNFAAEPGVSTHYVSLGYVLNLPDGAAIRGDPQHHELKWFPIDEALHNDRVHAYTKEFLTAAGQKQHSS
jgi:colanic acid biosynthesis protein WcaH